MNTDMDTILRMLDVMSEKNDALLKITGDKILENYSILENHCIYWIGIMDQPNVTKLSNKLNITRGGISKVLKKLVKNGELVSYQSDMNRKEKYYALTEKGQEVFQAHLERHKKTKEREQQFFQNISEAEVKTILHFLESYAEFLNQSIEELLLESGQDQDEKK